VERSMPCLDEAKTEARFLELWYKATGLYECRGTNEISDWYLVTLQKLNKWALVQCRGTS